MKRLIALLLVFLFCAPALAEPEATPAADAATGDVELFSYIGRPFEELYADIGGELDRHYFPDGATVYLHWLAVTARHTFANADIKHGWPDDTVYYISVSDAGYSLYGIRVGDTEAEIRALCEAEGWTVMEEAPKYCDLGYETTIEDVKYTLGVIFEYGTDEINLVDIEAEKLAPAGEQGSWLSRFKLID